ncbi:LysR family transcriptional regulator [bacterium]|nr:LysR family transcriptional regulator [bacterium]
MITIDNLRHFVAVVENNGLNRAADKIAISPSSLSRSIQGIEDQVGRKVFDRVGRKVVLNATGRDLYARAKPLLQEFQSLTRAPQPSLVGHYQIGASHFICRHFAAKKMAQITKTHPEASFDLFSLDTSVLVKKLLRGELDLGLGISPRLPEGLACTQLSAGTMYLCAAKNSALVKVPFAKLAKKLCEVPAIMHRPTESVERCDNHPMFKIHGIKPRIQLYWDSDDVAVEMLQSGDYWTMLPDAVIGAHPGIRRLAHPTEWRAPYEVSLIRNKQRSDGALEGLFTNTGP